MVEIIKTRFRPDKIILFGPYFSGHITPRSEINLLIIKDTFISKANRAKEIESYFINNPKQVDILFYTPLELEISLKNKSSFISKIMMLSWVLYDKEIDIPVYEEKNYLQA